jgi:hypothetical protein
MKVIISGYTLTLTPLPAYIVPSLSTSAPCARREREISVCPLGCGIVQQRLPIAITGIADDGDLIWRLINQVLEKYANDLQVPRQRGKVERTVIVLVDTIDKCAVREKEARDLDVPPSCGKVQRSLPVVIAGVAKECDIVGRIGREMFENNASSIQVPTMRCKV